MDEPEEMSSSSDIEVITENHCASFNHNPGQDPHSTQKIVIPCHKNLQNRQYDTYTKCPSRRTKKALSPYDQAWKDRRARRSAKRLVQIIKRREARLTPSQLVAYEQRQVEKREMRAAENGILKEACIQGELKRAKKAARVDPKTFLTISFDEESNNDSESKQKIAVHVDDMIVKSKFVGRIIIQDRLSAMRQALSEHVCHAASQRTYDRHCYFVDAAVSHHHKITGIGVANRTELCSGVSSWIVQGHRIYEDMDQDRAEVWAIWRALQISLTRAYGDQKCRREQESYCVVVIYSDSKQALHLIEKSCLSDDQLFNKIGHQSQELKRLGIDVELHWVTGHRDIPGIELADLVSKSARKPT